MKPVIVFAITFVVGAAASTGAKVMLAKPAAHAPAGADSTAAADSTQADSTKSAEAATAKPASDSSPAASVPQTDTSKPGTPSPTVAAAGGAATDSKTPAPQLPAANDTATQTAERRVAKVFTSMEAKQAAEVLKHMTDGDVHVILGYVGPRQAASILAELPPERVAALSKLAMKPATGGQK